MWTVGFIVLGLMIAACGVARLCARRRQAAPSAARGMQRLIARPGPQRAGWVCLAFVPSGLLVAFTSYVTTDIASAPFLWVVPLAMFLGTFILVFRDPPLIPHRADAAVAAGAHDHRAVRHGHDGQPGLDDHGGRRARWRSS